MALTLTINGQAREFEALESGATLAVLVEALGLKADRVAVERNGELSPRSGWGGLALGDGDRLEIVHFVGGGLS